jgi:5-(carboxyamino)imidazole ribonucleotide synthase
VPVPLPPGSTIGIIGGGQLGRMLAMEARRLGYRTCVLDPDPQSPAGQVADDRVVASLSDAEAMRELARRVQVATYEFENVDAGAVGAAEALVPVYPGSMVLRIAQHRVLEKMTVARLGFPVPDFAALRSRQDLDEALRRIPLPLVLKTATAGYDGKGQAMVQSLEEAESAFDRLAARCDTLIAEAFVDFAMELSVICARTADGRVACYPPAENRHRAGILDVTLAPARVPPAVVAQARDVAVGIAEGLGLVGLLAVEMFLARDGRLLVNELAPRPHNSGHHTLDACATSQFEQLLRAICHLPLGATELYAPAAMANLLGDLWREGRQPDFTRALAVPGVRLHLYGKAAARPGRKMGHLCAVADPLDVALERVLTARSALSTD